MLLVSSLLHCTRCTSYIIVSQNSWGKMLLDIVISFPEWRVDLMLRWIVSIQSCVCALTLNFYSVVSELGK